jgi:thiol-disulfide isomerase/thioredoxin
MKKLLPCLLSAYCACLGYSQPESVPPHPEPLVVVDNIAITHEHKGWRVINASTMPIHFNLLKGDLIVRIDGRNAADTGPMTIASLLSEGSRRYIDVFVERGDFPMETKLRELSAMDVDPVGAIPLRHVMSGFSAPDAEFKDIDGKPLSLEQFKGTWLLINFTGTWCGSCMQTLPEVLSVAEHNDLSLNLLVVALNDRAEAVRRMQQKYSITSPIANMQSVSELPVAFGIATNQLTGQIPALVLIRPDGEVALIAIGVSFGDHLEHNIKCLVSGNCTGLGPMVH